VYNTAIIIDRHEMYYVCLNYMTCLNRALYNYHFLLATDAVTTTLLIYHYREDETLDIFQKINDGYVASKFGIGKSFCLYLGIFL
jgi:hypothetical protein